MSTSSARKFIQGLPPEDTELMICPPECSEQHDAKWHGVTVPVPKDVKAKLPVMWDGPTWTTPKCIPTWEDPYPSLGDKEWRAAMLRDGKSCWVHRKYPVEGKIHQMVPPTAQQLQRHAQRYGLNSPATLASVHEVGMAYGILVGIPKSALVPKKRPRQPSRKERAQQILDLGHSWNIVEDELNLSRAQSIELKEEILGVGA